MSADDTLAKPDTPWRRGRRAIQPAEAEKGRYAAPVRRIGRRRTIVPAPAGLKH